MVLCRRQSARMAAIGCPGSRLSGRMRPNRQYAGVAYRPEGVTMPSLFAVERFSRVVWGGVLYRRCGLGWFYNRPDVSRKSAGNTRTKVGGNATRPRPCGAGQPARLKRDRTGGP